MVKMTESLPSSQVSSVAQREEGPRAPQRKRMTVTNLQSASFLTSRKVDKSNEPTPALEPAILLRAKKKKKKTAKRAKPLPTEATDLFPVKIILGSGMQAMMGCKNGLSVREFTLQIIDALQVRTDARVDRILMMVASSKATISFSVQLWEIYWILQSLS